MAEAVWPTVDAWRPMAATAGSTGTQLECGEMPCVAKWSVRDRPHHVIRYVGTRRAIPGEMALHDDELPAVGGRPACATDHQSGAGSARSRIEPRARWIAMKTQM